MNRHVSTSVNGYGAELTVIADGQEYRAREWSLDYETSYIDITSIMDAQQSYVPGAARITLRMNGVQGPSPALPVRAPGEDIVTHTAVLCCCPKCPGGCR